MAARTISDAYFSFTSGDGKLVVAKRGETVDIPEGEDLTRGDDFGAFNAVVGEEPAPPFDTALINLQPDWTAVAYDRYLVDAHVDELKDKFGLVAELDRTPVATGLYEAELRGRGRQAVLDYLAPFAGLDSPAIADFFVEDTTPADVAPIQPAEAAVPESPVPAAGTAVPGAGELLDVDEEAVTEPLAADDGLVTADSTVDAILDYVGEHPEEAPAFLAAEEVKTKPRVSLVEGLNKIIEG